MSTTDCGPSHASSSSPRGLKPRGSARTSNCGLSRLESASPSQRMRTRPGARPLASALSAAILRAASASSR
eukprot:3190341-Prymnesium_polylepis.1